MLSLLLLSLSSMEAMGDNATGIVKVVSQPEGASVYLNGRVFGPTPVLVELAKGTHSLVISLDGYPPKKRDVTIKEGRVIQTKVVFTSEVPKNGIRVHELQKGGKDAGPGTVLVTTEPAGLVVIIDGKVVSKRTPVAFDIHSGVYRLKIKQDGDVVLEKTVFVRAGRTSEYEFAVKKRRSIDDKDPWR